jgi:protein-S-isoprenylcysteine O-methyltransferase Ste14
MKKGTGVILFINETVLYSVHRMAPAAIPQTQREQRDPAIIVRAGAWLFRHRTITPGPLALAVLFVPLSLTRGSAAVVAAGVVLVGLGEGLRLWGVRHIGTISRTRSDRLGPLVISGPFAFARNPLYVGNIALWTGFAVSARLPWLVPLFVAILAFEYHAIVRWEERLLEERLGDRYRAYAAQVPRWIPNGSGRTTGSERLECPVVPAPSPANVFSWRETFYSERGTLIAIAAGYLLLWIKYQV